MYREEIEHRFVIKEFDGVRRVINGWTRNCAQTPVANPVTKKRGIEGGTKGSHKIRK